MVAGEEPMELCEECGSPLVDGRCGACGTGYSDGASPVGAAPLDRRELSRVLGRNVGARAHGSYSLSMQQEEGMAPLRREIELLVERFGAPPEARAAVKRNAERLALGIVGELGPTKAAIACVAQEFLRLGRSMPDVSSHIAEVHPGIDSLKDLVVEVYPEPGRDVSVLVNGRGRPHTAHSAGVFQRLRIPIFVSDSGALFELRNARLTRDGYDARRVQPQGPTEFIVRIDDSSFGLFKVLKEARLAGLPGSSGDLSVSFRKYSISKLPLTELLLKESGLFNEVSAEYAKRYASKAGDGQGRSPRKLAEEALQEACEAVVPASLSDLIVSKFRLKPAAVKFLLVRDEPASHWLG
ncbi:MAG: hypothetical protein JRN06_00135 [Nitrososphaerota archaeon]|nr:hypothetical protein [Nitrososphaerota archaeon]MDG7023740.1 hypothetical protein [Nitrososphaerota archaeon]